MVRMVKTLPAKHVSLNLILKPGLEVGETIIKVDFHTCCNTPPPHTHQSVKKQVNILKYKGG